jgi:hypothetical protein
VGFLLWEVSISFTVLTTVIRRNILTQHEMETGSDLVLFPIEEGKDLQKSRLNNLNNLPTLGPLWEQDCDHHNSACLANRRKTQTTKRFIKDKRSIEHEARSLNPSVNHQPDKHVTTLDQP